MTNGITQKSLLWQACLMVGLAGIIITAPGVLLAQADTPIGDVLCTVGTWLTGNTGKGLVTIAVIIIGIGCLMGKVSWGMAAAVTANIAVVFSAGAIVDAMGASTPSIACDINVAGNPASIPASGQGAMPSVLLR